MAHAMRPAGAVMILRARDPPRVMAAAPAVEGVGADAEVAAGQVGVPPVALIEVHPLQAQASLSGLIQKRGRCGPLPRSPYWSRLPPQSSRRDGRCCRADRKSTRLNSR